MAPSPARAVALEALRKWPMSHDFADVLLQRVLRSGPPDIRYAGGARLAYTELEGSDRAFAQELFYGVLRNLTLLDFYIDQLRKTQIDPSSRDLLRLGLYQLFKLQTSEHAAIFETVELCKRAQKPLINAVLRHAVRHRDELEKAAAGAPISVRESHPAFLLTRWAGQFDEKAAVALALWNNQPAPLYARVNTLRIAPAEFARKYPEMRPLGRHSLFFQCEKVPREAIARGDCYIQDPSTAVAVELLDANPADKILDACAAPGGKTSFLAAITSNDARVVACDRDPQRVVLLRTNLERLGVVNVKTVEHDWLRGGLEAALFDKVLLDAPCTNTGVIRRRVDVRWRLRPDDFDRMQKQQIAVARAVIPMLKSGGVFVYSTCSLEPEENEGVAEQLAREFPQLKLEKIASVLPFRDGFDGAFAARFVC